MAKVVVYYQHDGKDNFVLVNILRQEIDDDILEKTLRQQKIKFDTICGSMFLSKDEVAKFDKKGDFYTEVCETLKTVYQENQEERLRDDELFLEEKEVSEERVLLDNIDTEAQEKIEAGIQYFGTVLSDGFCVIDQEAVGIKGWMISGHTHEDQRNKPALYTKTGLLSFIEDKVKGLKEGDPVFVDQLNNITQFYSFLDQAIKSRGECVRVKNLNESARKKIEGKKVKLEREILALMTKRNELVNDLQGISDVSVSQNPFLSFLKRVLIWFFPSLEQKLFPKQAVPRIDITKLNDEIVKIDGDLSISNNVIVECSDKINEIDQALDVLEDNLIAHEHLIQKIVGECGEMLAFFSPLTIQKNQQLQYIAEKIEALSDGTITVRKNIACILTREPLPLDVAVQPITKFIEPFLLVTGAFFMNHYRGGFEGAANDPAFKQFKQFVDGLAPEFSMDRIEQSLNSGPPIVQALEKIQKGDVLSGEETESIRAFGLQDWQLQKLCHEFLPNLSPDLEQAKSQKKR